MSFAPVLWLWPQHSAADCLTPIIWHVETGNWRGATLLGTEVVPAQRQRSRRWEISSVTLHDHTQQIHVDYHLCATEKELEIFVPFSFMLLARWGYWVQGRVDRPQLFCMACTTACQRHSARKTTGTLTTFKSLTVFQLLPLKLPRMAKCRPTAVITTRGRREIQVLWKHLWYKITFFTHSDHFLGSPCQPLWKLHKSFWCTQHTLQHSLPMNWHSPAQSHWILQAGVALGGAPYTAMPKARSALESRSGCTSYSADQIDC